MAGTFEDRRILSDARTAACRRKLNQPRDGEPTLTHVPADLKDRARLLSAARAGDPVAVERLRVEFRAWIVVAPKMGARLTQTQTGRP